MATSSVNPRGTKARRALCLCASGVVFLLLPLTIAIAGSPFRLRPPLWVDHDDRPIPEPKEREASDIFGIVHNTWVRHLSVEYKAMQARKQPALNVNAWDDVPNSTWFTNRMGLRSLSFEEIINGLEGKPPGSPPWRIVRRNDSGFTPKVDIEDASGRRYVLKFDPPGGRERNSGAERIGTLITYGAGYNVPHNSIVYFRPEDLKLDDKSYYRDPKGKRRPLTQADVDAVIQRLDAMPDGRYRGLASLYLPGKPLGPFMFTGWRKDDPNDIIPHELRREIRGMRVMASWINHVDVKDGQALDIYYTAPDGRKFVKHHLLDFGSTMGAYEWPSAPYRVGHEYMFDGAAMGRSFVTLGIWQRPWEVYAVVRYPEVGYYAAELFEPAKWKPSYPNLAFEQMDDADAYWGAKIVTAFTDETIQKLAEAGEYSRPEVTRYVEEVLRRRRDAIGNYWLDRITPLEQIVLEQNDGGPWLRFRDLAVERAYAGVEKRIYRYWFQDLKGRKLSREVQSSLVDEKLKLMELPLRTARPKEVPDRYGRTPLFRLFVQSNRRGGGWALPIEIILGIGPKGSSVQVLGWNHAAR